MRLRSLALITLLLMAACASAPPPSPPPPPPPPPSPSPPPPPPENEGRGSSAADARRYAQAKAQAQQDEAARKASTDSAAAARQTALQMRAAAPDSGTPTEPPQRAPAATPMATAPISETPAAQETDTSTAAVDRILSQLTLGDVAFNAPSKMNIEETISIRVALSPDKGEAAVRERIEEPGAKISQTLQISNLMEARLTGEGFRIVAVTPERQAVSSGITEWIWDITPLQEGRHQLTLSMDALITVNGEVVPKTLRTFRKPIEVEVTATQRASGLISEHGKWAWTTLLLPLFGWLAKKRKDGGKPKASA